ncbi:MULTISPECIES: Crp/Fnr family transcriptional regulator [unclassified Cupriavidus]|uniref:Crp/Fnr family transcriptional regulator n=1 Tax=unclassified Cupriavidus TaxID=2640874 RepID=UPI00136655EC|nr:MULTISPECIES: Crp/Fnr family transcriptional regulator [unclassified Cupriavidus]
MRNIKTARMNVEAVQVMLASHPLWSQTIPIEPLLADASITALQKGDCVFRQGQRADYWYLVMCGRIDTLRIGIDGEDRILHHALPGQWLAPIVMFMPHRTYPVEARAAEDSTLCRFGRDNLHQTCLDHPQLALCMLALAADVLHQRIDDVDTLASTSAAQRLAAYLLKLANKTGMRVEFPLSQRQLAAKLGIRAETLNRLLADWQKLGYLEGRGRAWRITTPRALETLAGNVACPADGTAQALSAPIP